MPARGSQSHPVKSQSSQPIQTGQHLATKPCRSRLHVLLCVVADVRVFLRLCHLHALLHQLALPDARRVVYANQIVARVFVNILRVVLVLNRVAEDVRLLWIWLALCSCLSASVAA